MKQSYAEELEWARLRVSVATERAASARGALPRDRSSARRSYEAELELRRASLWLRARLAEALHENANPLFWHDRFGQPRSMGVRAYQLSA